MKITEEQVEKNLEFLTSTDQKEAELEVAMLKVVKEEKHLINKMKVERFGNHKSNTEKETQAYASDDYQEYVKKLIKVTLDYKTLRNQRDTAESYNSMFQSMIKRGAI